MWDDFLAQGGFIPGEVVTITPFKAGTPWLQGIVQQLLCNGADPNTALSEASP
ncbi:hypothetical protein [Synechocystis sp. PCC 6714]|uniref:hypothetical protein n=1 Tax=Synechocystis sp. (strain PCC 6714) TaxID=1147 RepID=UPI000423DAED|nr:hypothetical protein [Synechocystis sp. PCC 6714]AIE75194.1 hypothetical protein D082_26660 [Synechocystis sp. PCC 6714]